MLRIEKQLEVFAGLSRAMAEDHPKRSGWMIRAAETLLKVRARSGELVPLAANRAQREFERRVGRQNVVLKARQMGMTTWIAARMFLETITRPGTLTVQVAHDLQSVEEMFKIVHRFEENLPKALREGLLKTSRSNVRELVFPEIDCAYRVETAADPNAGRGLTIRNLHCSEVALWPRDAAATLAALRAAVPADGVVVLESTPSGASGAFYEEWRRAGETGAVRHFFPWWMEESYAGVWAESDEPQEDERELMEREGLSLEQIAYRRQLKASFRGLAAQEFAEDAETCFLVSGDCLFDVGLVQERLCDCDETATDTKVWRFFPAVNGKEYVVGVDPAGGGIEGDYACAQVVERATGLQCAELKGHLSPRELARAVAELGHEYNDAVVAVERNNHGHEVIAYLQHELEYERLWADRNGVGWLTSLATRGPMLAEMEAWFAMYPERVQSRRLLEEMKTFVRKENGRAEAANGAHDDAVMAMGIALKCRC